jgi:hypothetical protein
MIKGPTIMRKLLAIGFPSFSVRLIKRVWGTLGDPVETTELPRGVIEGLHPRVEYDARQLESFAFSMIMNMLVHGPEVYESLELSGVKDIMMHYRCNKKRMHMCVMRSQPIESSEILECALVCDVRVVVLVT